MTSPSDHSATSGSLSSSGLAIPPGKKPFLSTTLAGLFLFFLPLASPLDAVVGYGALDPSFDPALNGAVRDLKPLFDGRLLLLGDFTEVNGVSRPGLALIDQDGNLDESFDPGTGANGRIHCLDERLIFGGEFTEFNGVSSPYLVKLNLDGSIDESFDPGSGPNAPVRTLAVGPRPLASYGRVLALGGDFTEFDGRPAGYVTMIELDGASLDPRASTRGRLEHWLPAFRSESPVDLLRVGSSSIWIHGSFPAQPGETTEGLLLFLLRSYGRDRIPVNGPVQAMEIIDFTTVGTPDYDLILSGPFSEVGDVACEGLAIVGRERLISDGRIPVTVPRIPIDGRELRSFQALKVSSFGKGTRPAVRMVLSGTFPESANGPGGIAIWDHVELEQTIGAQPFSYPDEDFEAGAGADGEVSVVFQEFRDGVHGRVFLGGSFQTIDGVAQPYLARLHGSLGSTVPEPPGTPEGLVTRSGKVALRWEEGERQESFIVEASGDGGLTWLEAQTTTEDFLLLEENGTGRRDYRIRARNLNGPSAPSATVSLNLDDRLASLGGAVDRTATDRLPPGLVAKDTALRANGNLLVANNGIARDEVQFGPLLEISPDVSMIRDFPQVAGWNPTTRIDAVEVLASGEVLIAGTFQEIGDHETSNIAKLRQDGTVDPGFRADLPFTWRGFDISRLDDIGVFSSGRIAVQGLFDQVGTLAASSLAFLESNGSLNQQALLPQEYYQSGARLVAGFDDTMYLAHFGPYGEDRLTSPVNELDPKGNPNPAFDPSLAGRVQAVSLDRRGRLLVAMRSSSPTPGPLPLARLLPDGTHDPSFHPPHVPNQSFCPLEQAKELPDGRILILGNFWTLDRHTAPYLAVLFPNGRIDPSFSISDLLDEEMVESLDRAGGNQFEIQVTPSGRLFVLRKNSTTSELGNRALSLELSNPLAVWLGMHSLTEQDLSGDTDADGSPDLLEYALHSSPVDRSSRPTLSFTPGNSKVLTVKAPREEVLYFFEQSEDLESWSSTGLRVNDLGHALEVQTEERPGETVFLRMRVRKRE